MSQVLRDARRYEEEREQFISEDERPAFHLSARVGWMNDPNGFSYYNEKYHLFYQFHPYDSHWGPMHWGHAVSDDLLHWEYLPAVLAPDNSYDRDGCYSGNAITLDDGRQMLMYTGMVYETDENGERRELQMQCLAFGDGLNYEKYEHNPVLTADDLPEGGNKYAFRDPKILRQTDGTFRALIANDVKGCGGQMLVFRSDDALHWEYSHALVKNRYRIGLMWECPDFFELQGKHVLLGSAQDMIPDGLEYHNGNGTFYMIGSYNEETEQFEEETNHAVDYGIDFYAPQTVLTPDGRRIMIGWMQNWDTCNLRTESIPWYGQMSLPRELFIKKGVLYQRPIREFDAMRGKATTYKNVKVKDGVVTLPGIDGRFIDLELEISATNPKEEYRKFALRFAQDARFHTGFSFRPHESAVKIDRKFSGSRRAIIHQRRADVAHRNGTIRFRLILDRFSAEIFINDGEKVMSATIYTDISADGISFFADGDVTMNVTKYELKV
ncbi:MAG: glycoside hydrolase family 32 protein [Lachnospiraceae bacterium]|nr:glycoside hydrolase family 32 protein [Lachnospiraceae bacterium]